MFQRLKEMLIKELILIFRDPRARTMVILPPIIQLLVFGYAATTDVRHAPTAVFDQDNTVSSRDLVSRFVKSGYFYIQARVDNEARARFLVDTGQVAVVLRMHKGFEDDLRSGRTARAQMILDGTDSNTAGILLRYGQTIASRFTDEQLRARLALKTPGRTLAGVNLESRTWFNENLESRNFMVPGVIAILLMLVTLTLTSMAVVREKEMGTLEQMAVSPIRPWEFVWGKTLPFALIGFFDMFLVVVIARYWFEVPIRGHLGWLMLGTALYLMTGLGIGLLISSISNTQQQALMSTFFFFQPAVLLSGFMFPIQNMPTVIQWITYLDPLRYFLIIIRGIFLKGVGWYHLWPQMAALLVMGVATYWIAARQLRKTLE